MTRDHLGNVYKNDKEMCDNYGIACVTYYRRMANGWSLKKALTTPTNPPHRNRLCKDHLGNVYDSLELMCEAYNITVKCYRTRMGNGWSLERTLTTPMSSLDSVYEPKHKVCQDHLGKKYSSVELMCQAYGIPEIVYNIRRRFGWSVKDALLTKL